MPGDLLRGAAAGVSGGCGLVCYCGGGVVGGTGVVDSGADLACGEYDGDFVVGVGVGVVWVVEVGRSAVFGWDDYALLVAEGAWGGAGSG